MPRKARDYKAEYAASKARATRLGYKSEREYRAVARDLGTTPPPRETLSATFITEAKMKRSEPAKARRRLAKEWSDKHSHVPTSRYRARMSDREVTEYIDAFVNKPTGDRRSKQYKAAKLRKMRKYLVPNHMDAETFDDRYKMEGS